jgi:hypothetical protein
MSREERTRLSRMGGEAAHGGRGRSNNSGSGGLSQAAVETVVVVAAGALPQ